MDEPMTVEQAIELAQLLSQLPLEETDLLVDRMQREQPVLYRYLAALGRPPFGPREHQNLCALGLTLWQIMERGGRPAKRVTGEMLDRAQKSLWRELERVAALPEEERKAQALQNIVSHSEPGLLGFLTAALNLSADPPFPEQEARLEAMYHLRVVLDALLASRRPPRRRGARRTPSTGRA